MKKTQFILLICLFTALIATLTACSDDFLKKNAWNPDLTLEMTAKPPTPQAGIQKLVLTVPGAGNSAYSLVKFPGWMTPEHFEGVTSNDVLSLTYDYDGSSFHMLSYHNFTFGFEIEGLGQVDVQVYFQESADVFLDLKPEKLDFNMESSEQSLRLINNSEQKIDIQVTRHPEWIKPESSAHFILWPGETVHLVFNCNRAGKPSGTHTDHIVFNCNGKIVSVPVVMQVKENINKDLFAIAGIVSGAAFDKKTGMMYIATHAPNQIVAYNTVADSKLHIALPQAPKSIKLSENGDQLFIGHSGLISIVNTATYQITSSIEVDFSIFDLVYGENDWCYISIDDVNKYGLYAVHCKTKEAKKVTEFDFDFIGPTYLTKIKGQPLILSSRKHVTPSGVILVDITNPAAITNKYWHEDYGRLWLSEDQKYCFGTNSQVFKTPNMATDELFIYNTLQLEEIYPYFSWIEHAEATASLWVVKTTVPWDMDRSIRRFETVDYTLVETIYPDDSFAVVDGISGFYPTTVHYLFVDQTGKNVFVIKNIYHSSEEYNSWSVQKLKTE